MNDEKKDPAKVAAVIDNRNGTYTTLRCNSKEETHRPGYRRIVGRFTGFQTRGAALMRAELIEQGRIR